MKPSPKPIKITTPDSSDSTPPLRLRRERPTVGRGVGFVRRVASLGVGEFSGGLGREKMQVYSINEMYYNVYIFTPLRDLQTGHPLESPYIYIYCF